MPKRQNLKGIPHNLVSSFFSTERYYHCGYMADWLVNAARILSLNQITIDILLVSIDPPTLNIRPLLLNVKELREIIFRTLKANGFPNDFMIDAKIKIEFLSTSNLEEGLLYCHPILIDKDGNRYDTKPTLHQAYGGSFNPFDKKMLFPQKVFSIQKFILKIKGKLNDF